MTLSEILALKDFLVPLVVVLVIFIIVGGYAAWSAADDCRRGMSDE